MGIMKIDQPSASAMSGHAWSWRFIYFCSSTGIISSSFYLMKIYRWLFYIDILFPILCSFRNFSPLLLTMLDIVRRQQRLLGNLLKNIIICNFSLWNRRSSIFCNTLPQNKEENQILRVTQYSNCYSLFLNTDFYLSKTFIIHWSLSK